MTIVKGRLQRYALGAGALLLGGLLTACGSSTKSTAPVSATPAGGGASSSSCVTRATAATTAAEVSPAMQLPQSKLNLAALKGKTIYKIDVVEDQFANNIDAGFTSAAHSLGMKAVVFNGQSSVSDWNQGVEQAIAAKAAAILLWGVPITEVSGPIATAEKDGIVVLQSFNADTNQPLAPGTYANVNTPEAGSGIVMADWMLADSKCKASVGILYTTTSPTFAEVYYATVAEMKRLCPSCKVYGETEDLSTLATSTGPQAEALLTAHSDINYMDPIVDSIVPFVGPAIAASHPSVTIVGQNGLPGNLNEVRSGGQQKMDEAFPPNAYIGYVYADEMARGILKMPVEKYVIPDRLITKRNAGTSNNSLFPTFANYVQRFQTAWGVGS